MRISKKFQSSYQFDDDRITNLIVTSFPITNLGLGLAFQFKFFSLLEDPFRGLNVSYEFLNFGNFWQFSKKIEENLPIFFFISYTKCFFDFRKDPSQFINFSILGGLVSHKPVSYKNRVSGKNISSPRNLKNTSENALFLWISLSHCESRIF